MKLTFPNVVSCTNEVVHDYLFNSSRSMFNIEAKPDKYGIVCIEEHDDTPTCIHEIEKVIFSGPCTIIIGNGKKTIVRTQEDERYDKTKGLLMCMCKHVMNPRKYHDVFEPYYNKPNYEKAVAKSILRYIFGKKQLDTFVKECL